MASVDDAVLHLARALPEPLTLVDAGCRWGFADTWIRFGDRARVFGFDPDAEEARRLEQRYREQPWIRVVPEGLGAEPGPATLYVTKEPAASSLYPPAAAVVDHHPGTEAQRLDHTRTVELTTLDNWAERDGIDCVDLIKLDTQGSELDILRGGERTLSSIRVIECEVQFNALYESVPLFADVERYLRRHGFVLWQLRNLAHHARAGVRFDFSVPTSWYHDVYRAELTAKAGQLFWADAFFVRSEVAAPNPGTGWAELARDACLTSSLAFYDLAQMALDASLEVAPPGAQPPIRAALASLEAQLRDDERARAERQAALSAAVPAVAAPPARGWELERDSVPLVGTHTVHLDGELEGTGWGSVRPGSPANWRWTGPGREAAIDLPLRIPPGTEIELGVVATMAPAILDQLVLEVNGLPVPLTLRHEADRWTFTGVVPRSYAPARHFTRLLVRTVETVPVDAPPPGELPAQGVGVAWVTLSAPATA